MISSNHRVKQSVVLLLVVILLGLIYLNTLYLPTVEHTCQTIKITDTSQAAEIIEEEETNVCLTDKVLRNVDVYHTAAHVDMWKHLEEKTLTAYQHQWQKFIHQVESEPMPNFKGRGIVMVAGNRDTFHRAITNIKLLRHAYGCILDIEVWHLDDEQPAEDIIEELRNLNVKARDLSDPTLPRPIIHRRGGEKQFQIKAAAIINSSFKEVLYLDSDNIPAKDPTDLFYTDEYNSTSALFWPDFWKTHGENKIFDILNIPCEDIWEQESGQMVLNKAKTWLPLQLAWYMQDHSEVYFQFLNGDKDTYKYAWQALNYPYHMSEVFLGMAGNMVGDRFCGHSMVQFDDYGNILFVHANLIKDTPPGSFITPNHIFDLLKRSTLSHNNTWIKPEFYVGNGRPCMDFTHREGEPEAVTEVFDDVLPQLQNKYFEYGGLNEWIS
ncbi:mannosyltransferase putative-domain-containing protein [Pilobolus umbonatus]|nr:mannosyltransferase putative-domain-containing protein [Pilobolus umbonatus]